MQCQHDFRLIQIKYRNALETYRQISNADRIRSNAPKLVPILKSGSMQKFALKFLLTNLLFARASKRREGIQLVTTLMTMALIVFVGLYAWTHSFY